jgi:hypothetical protein
MAVSCRQLNSILILLYAFIFPFSDNFRTPNSNSLIPRDKQKQKLTAGNQPASSLLASGPAGTHGHIFVQSQDLCLFFLSFVLLIDKKGVGLQTLVIYNPGSHPMENIVFSCRVLLCYLETRCSTVHREHSSYCCVFAGTCILSRCLAMGTCVEVS